MMTKQERDKYYLNLTKTELINKLMENNDKLNEIEKGLIEDLLDDFDTPEDIKPDSKLAKLSDKLTGLLGSWRFITISVSSIMSWILINLILKHPFDPFPFIFLNLVLSCIAAIQAPIIMMSQNRQEEKDRLKSINDFKVNLKSEILIEDLHTKLDKILDQQK